MMLMPPCGMMLESRGEVCDLARLLESSSLPLVQPGCLVPVCKCWYTLFGQRACGPLKEGMFRSAGSLCKLVCRLLQTQPLLVTSSSGCLT